MTITDEHICEVTENVWSTFLGLDVRRRPPGETPAVDEWAFAGWVKIKGAASIMFGIDVESTDAEQTHLALSELTNMTGGNLKSLFPPPAKLCLPTVMPGNDVQASMRGSRVVRQVAFECQGYPLLVLVLEGGEAAT